jgi:hypothetical protein
MKISLNDIVRIKLTDYGQARWLGYWTNKLSYATQTIYGKSSITIPIVIPNVEQVHAGYIETELWSIMQVFGDAMYMGGDQYFVNNEIEVINDN